MRLLISNLFFFFFFTRLSCLKYKNQKKGLALLKSSESFGIWFRREFSVCLVIHLRWDIFAKRFEWIIRFPKPKNLRKSIRHQGLEFGVFRNKLLQFRIYQWVKMFDDSFKRSCHCVENITHFPSKKRRTHTHTPTTMTQYDKYECLWIIAKTIRIIIDQENLYIVCVLIFLFFACSHSPTSFMIQAELNQTTRTLSRTVRHCR